MLPLLPQNLELRDEADLGYAKLLVWLYANGFEPETEAANNLRAVREVALWTEEGNVATTYHIDSSGFAMTEKEMNDTWGGPVGLRAAVGDL